MTQINLVFTVEQLKVIDTALQQTPYYVAAPIIKDINSQIQKHFDKKIDDKNMPTGQTMPPDEQQGS